MNLSDLHYITARLIRRRLPKKLTDFLLDRSLIIKPGGITAYPEKFINNYLAAIKDLPVNNFADKSIMELGFGGNAAIGFLYHLHGASKIYLVDPYAKDRAKLSIEFLKKIKNKHPEHDFKAEIKNGSIHLSTDIYKLHFARLEHIGLEDNSLDFIFSTSVLEHIDDVKELLSECYNKLKPNGYFLAFVDVGDHFQKYPFNMLKYKRKTWNNYLNPPSNLNRLRTLDYENFFTEIGFKPVKKKILTQNREEFFKIKDNIDAEFKKYPVEELVVLSVLYIYQK